MTSLRLSIEEVAFALGYVGGADTAAGFLTSLIGQHTPDDLSGRLTAASHSLVARELLTLASAPSEASLDPALRRAVESMMKGDDVLRATITNEGSDRAVSFFLTDSGAVQHELANGVVSHITLLEDTTQVREAVARILAPADFSDVAGEPIGRISVAQLRELRLQANTASASDLAPLLARTLSPSVAAAIATTMCDDSATWTVTLRLVTDEAGKPEANRGIFTMYVPRSGWLFDMSNDPMQATVYALNSYTAAVAAARLMAA